MSDISVVIPTYQRAEIALDTIQLLLNQVVRADEILIIDQTVYSETDPSALQLSALHEQGDINWVRIDKPSIPNAMNLGLRMARSSYVLFLDDDSSFKPSLIKSYRTYLENREPVAIVGQVVQPYETPAPLAADYFEGGGIYRDLDFKFNSIEDRWVHNCMAGNLLVNRRKALGAGGFDQQFEGVAYRFETEFCRRLIRFSGTPFLFGPRASIDHLKLPTGGTRSKVSNFLTSASGTHAQGDYYFALRESRGRECWQYICKRFFGSVVARFYLRNPWWIPARLVGETRGLLTAIGKFRGSPIYMSTKDRDQL